MRWKLQARDVALIMLTLATTAAGPLVPSANGAPSREPEPVVRGIVTKRALAADPDLQYFLYVPRRVGPGAPVFVSVHGISRNAREHADRFAPFAEAEGVVLVAPRFSRTRFPDYQRLGREGGDGRADLALARILDEVGSLTGANVQRVSLFGFSGGGQFVHRFAMVHPQRVEAYVVGSAGWYTFPDAEARYPYGTRGMERVFGEPFDVQAFLSIPATVVVGERDVHPGTALRKTRRVEDAQGATRYERGQRWVAAMNKAAAATGLSAQVRFIPLARSPHSFAKAMRRGDMGQKVFDSLYWAAH